VLKGRVQQAAVRSQVRADGAALWSRLDDIDGRLDEIVKLIAGLKADIATVIEQARHDG
jgi:TolB-like protein